MWLAVFGGGGRTGRLVLEAALARGHGVRALLRSPRDLDARVEVVLGDARDPAAVARALEGAGAAISVLTIPEGAEPTDALSAATRTIVEQAAVVGPRRLVVTTNSAVFHDRPVADPYRVIAEEHRRGVAVLRSSGLDWTVLAPTALVDAEPAGAYEAVLDRRAPRPTIARADLAAAVLDALDRPDWVGHLVGVCGPPEAA
ncbi:MAG: hypothetical protein KatS3mg013_0865 [Actinomycetota bacterium]|jgi:uncharacterized protein YbjT (DUF2867 family)|nr:MAG: hypothetical protein KatS3mg013_0865 [Actinomycetota bacterium]